AEFLTCAPALILPTMAMGALFSHLIQSARFAVGAVGRVTAFNTLGGALAPVFFGVFIIPTCGTKWALVLITVGYAVMSFAALPSRKRFFALLPIALMFALLRTLQGRSTPRGGRALA